MPVTMSIQLPGCQHSVRWGKVWRPYILQDFESRNTRKNGAPHLFCYIKHAILLHIFMNIFRFIFSISWEQCQPICLRTWWWKSSLGCHQNPWSNSRTQICSRIVVLDGVFIWWLSDRNIVVFDFNDEVLPMTPLPDLLDYRERSSTITVLNENVAFLAFSSYPKCDLEIWVLLEFGVKESWTRLATIGLSMDLEWPGFWWRGELFMVNSEGQLGLYDPFTPAKKSLQINGVDRTFQIVLHRPISVVVNGGVNPWGICFLNFSFFWVGICFGVWVFNFCANFGLETFCWL